eukprot:scaffold50_cov420-Prasinococcus_capsulatus_cf.AAC.2
MQSAQAIRSIGSPCLLRANRQPARIHRVCRYDDVPFVVLETCRGWMPESEPSPHSGWEKGLVCQR